MIVTKKSRIVAADDDFDNDFDNDFDDLTDDDDGFNDQLDDIADDIEDMKDNIDDMAPDDPNIEIENNIDGHYIAECERCKGIFISAVSESDQVVKSIHGTCPLCEEETEQYLKWVVTAVE